MEIINKGEKLDPTVEHEIILKDPGMNVELTYTNGKKEIFHNITEVHWLYRNGMVALETDVHGTGFTKFVNTLAKIDITEATEVAEEV